MKCSNNNCVTSGNRYWVGTGGVKTPLTSTDLDKVNSMTVDSGYKCIILWNNVGTDYNDLICTDKSLANTVCEFDVPSLSPTGKFLFLNFGAKICYIFLQNIMAKVKMLQKI